MLDHYNLVELFSGIGSQYKALTNLGVKVNTLATSEWDVHAIVAYDYLYGDGEIPDEIAEMDKPELLKRLYYYQFSNTGKTALDEYSLSTYSLDSLRHIYASIKKHHNRVDITSFKGTRLPEDVDILTYSFPCQDLSNVGAFHGYTKGIDKGSGSRSSLLWQVGRILTETKYSGKKLPRFLVMENVPNLLSRRHKPNFEIWINDLNRLGYVSQYYELNATSFGLPQNRPRLLMLSVYVGDSFAERDLVKTYFSYKSSDAIVADYTRSEFYHPYSVQDLLRTNYDDPTLMAEAIECTPNDTVSRRKIWEDNPQIILPGNKFNQDIQFIRTITTKQDRNPNSGNLYFESGVDGRSSFRYLTPRECMLFMGFDETDYLKLKNNNVEFHSGDALFSRDKIIRMAGNSIPVKLLEGIFLQVLQIDELLSEYRKNVTLDLFGNIVEEDYLSEIRSYMFAHGLRSRDSTLPFTETADILYPKYKSAVFVREGFMRSHPLCTAKYSTNNKLMMKEIAKELESKDAEEYRELNANGWNTLVLSQYDLDNAHWSSTMRWLESQVRSNIGSSAEEGKVLIYG